MRRWQAIIDMVLADLEAEALDAEGFRIRVDERIHEGEMLAAHAESANLDETPKQRSKIF